MIIGNYPCCNATLCLVYYGQGFHKEVCETCGSVVWHKMSNIDPCSYTEDDFLEEFDVDELKMTITKKCKTTQA